MDIKKSISTRLYPAEFPEVGDLVIVKVTEIGPDVIYCHLLEYDKQGMLSYGEVSRKKIRNIRHIIRVGNQECMEVISVDTDKGYIDLSRKQIADDDKKECGEQYAADKRIYTYFYRWSIQTNQDLVSSVLWQVYDEEERYDHLIANQQWQEQLPEDYVERMMEDFHKMFEKKATKHELDVEMVCYSVEGVDALQEAVDKAMELSTEDVPIQCTYTGKTGTVGNIFQLCTITKEDNAEEMLMTAAKAMERSLAQYNSRFMIVAGAT